MSISPDRPILLVEDNPDDVELTRRAFRKNNLRNPVIVAADGSAALDYLFGRGEWEGRDIALKERLGAYSSPDEAQRQRAAHAPTDASGRQAKGRADAAAAADTTDEAVDASIELVARSTGTASSPAAQAPKSTRKPAPPAGRSRRSSSAGEARQNRSR